MSVALYDGKVMNVRELEEWRDGTKKRGTWSVDVCTVTDGETEKWMERK